MNRLQGLRRHLTSLTAPSAVAATFVLLMLTGLIAARLPAATDTQSGPGGGRLAFGAHPGGRIPPLTPSYVASVLGAGALEVLLGASPGTDASVPAGAGGAGRPESRVETQTPSGANDDFVDAVDVERVPFTDRTDTSAASAEAGEPQDCGPSGRSVWYRYTPTADGFLVADTLGSGFDTVLAVYRGNSLTSLESVACNGNHAGRPESLVVFEVQAGTSYAFQVAGAYLASGPLVFSLSHANPPANDNLADARPIAALPFSDRVPVELATTEEGESQTWSGCGGPTGHSVWYRYTAPRNAGVTVDTSGSDFLGVLRVFSGTSYADLEPLGCDEMNAPWDTAHVAWTAEAGRNYLIQAGGRSGGSHSVGTLVLNAGLTPPPVNDAFVRAVDLPTRGSQSYELEISNATVEAGEPAPSCASPGTTVWYRYQPAVDQLVSADTRSSSADAVLGVWEGTSLSGLTPVACGHRPGPDVEVGSEARVSFLARAGRTYYVQAGSFAGRGGALRLLWLNTDVTDSS